MAETPQRTAEESNRAFLAYPKLPLTSEVVWKAQQDEPQKLVLLFSVFVT